MSVTFLLELLLLCNTAPMNSSTESRIAHCSFLAQTVRKAQEPQAEMTPLRTNADDVCDPATAAVLEHLFRTLEEVFHLALHFQIGVGEIQALAERAAVSAGQAALRDEEDTDPCNSADLALITGLNRDMVIKLLKMGPRGVRDKPFQNPIRRIIRGWKSHEGYCEPDGSPKILPIHGESPSFHTLADATIGPDLAPRRILRRMRRLGFVKNIGPKSVQLVRSEVVDRSAIEHVDRLSDVCKLVRAIVQLVKRQAPVPYLRFIEATGLQTEKAGIRQRQLTRGADILFNTHETALAQEREQSDGTTLPTQTQRFSAAIFILREPEIESITNLHR